MAVRHLSSLTLSRMEAVMSMISETRSAMEQKFHDVMNDLSTLELKMLDAKFRTLEARDAGAKKLREEVARIKQKTVSAQEKLRDFSSDSSESWQTFQDGMENAWAELRTACSDAYAEFAAKDVENESSDADSCCGTKSESATAGAQACSSDSADS